MKHLTYATCATLLLAGFFGLCAIAESGLPLWEAVGLIASILLFELGVASVANKSIEKEGRA